MRRDCLAVLATVATLGCGGEKDTPPETEVDAGLSDSGEDSLPTIGGDFDCNEPLSRDLPLCVWAHATDAVVWASIEELNVDDVPRARRVEGGWEWDDACASFNAGLRIRAHVLRTLWGTVPEQLDVYIGHDQVQFFRPFPYSDDHGGVAWEPDGLPTLEVGQAIGLPLQQYERDDGLRVWSLSGERMFGLRSGRLYVQRAIGECAQLAPPITDLDLEGLEGAMAACGEVPSEEALDRRTLLRNEFGSTPWGYVASSCL